MSESAEMLITYCRENSRVCPMPERWTALWELLPDRKRVGGGWEPALPLILAAWHDTPGIQKMLRLAEHVEWAARISGKVRLAVKIDALQDALEAMHGRGAAGHALS